MSDFSEESILKFMLLKEGIPFDDLKPKSSLEVVGSSSKSLAESIMYDKGISVQDLKKGTIYDRPENSEKKKMKDEVVMAMEKDKEIYGDYDMEKDKEIYGDYAMAMGKNNESYGDLDHIVKKKE